MTPAHLLARCLHAGKDGRSILRRISPVYDPERAREEVKEMCSVGVQHCAFAQYVQLVPQTACPCSDHTRAHCCGSHGVLSCLRLWCLQMIDDASVGADCPTALSQPTQPAPTVTASGYTLPPKPPPGPRLRYTHTHTHTHKYSSVTATSHTAPCTQRVRARPAQAHTRPGAALAYTAC